MKKLFLLLALLSFVFTACDSGLDNEENGGTPSTPKIELSQQNVELGYEAVEHEVSVTSPYFWEATTKSSWIEIKTPSGIAGTRVLKFSVNRNEESEIREGTIVIKNTDYNLVAELYVTQMFQIISLGASTSNLICENTDGSCELNVISNVEYTATIVSGHEWLCFANTSALTYTGNGNGTLVFNHRANNNNKRVARLVLEAKNRVVEVKIKQKGVFEDYLEIHPDDIESFGFTNGTDGYCLDIPKVGGEYAIRLSTTCLDNQISCWCDNSDAVVDFEIMNSVLYFSVKENLDGQPRILHIELSYIDGWDDKVTYKFSIRQNFDSHNQHKHKIAEQRNLLGNFYYKSVSGASLIAANSL